MTWFQIATVSLATVGILLSIVAIRRSNRVIRGLRKSRLEPFNSHAKITRDDDERLNELDRRA